MTKQKNILDYVCKKIKQTKRYIIVSNAINNKVS